MISGEQITYAYDALNRLASAVTTDNPSVTQWGQSYNYDGFGNLTDQNVIKGSAPAMHVTYNASTNRQSGDSADANGNIGYTGYYTGSFYDIDNRLVQPGSTTVNYAYDAGNKRVWRGDTTPSPATDEVAFWAGNQKLATYQIYTSNVGGYLQLSYNLKTTRVYFGGKLVSQGTYNSGLTLAPVGQDRLGSIGKFYPYGQERPSATQNDTEKFTGYFRDASTGLDYADQRYHQDGVGRFMTPDPSGKSAKASTPGSWNRYSYVQGDPANLRDPRGLDDCDDDPAACGDFFADPYGEDTGVSISTPNCGTATLGLVDNELGDLNDYSCFNFGSQTTTTSTPPTPSAPLYGGCPPGTVFSIGAFGGATPPCGVPDPPALACPPGTVFSIGAFGSFASPILSPCPQTQAVAFIDCAQWCAELARATAILTKRLAASAAAKAAGKPFDANHRLSIEQAVNRVKNALALVTKHCGRYGGAAIVIGLAQEALEAAAAALGAAAAAVAI